LLLIITGTQHSAIIRLSFLTPTSVRDFVP